MASAAPFDLEKWLHALPSEHFSDFSCPQHTQLPRRFVLAHTLFQNALLFGETKLAKKRFKDMHNDLGGQCACCTVYLWKKYMEVSDAYIASAVLVSNVKTEDDKPEMTKKKT